MSIDERTARAIARLARLSLDSDEAENSQNDLAKLVEDFSKIVGYMDILNEAETNGVEPLYSPMLEPEPPRPDVPRANEGVADLLLSQAPEKVGRYFSVPKIV
ncbi:MAG: Asp-tRNA(Asn)/Glu-tRNA(Gln) amidotransferase subunit GatC [Deltaproteobacteria bacterium]|jgi:aspartyl-tRNA(Asn)/glutamyl-tRNA(Gln) amidotransferase subunit C|nr:Asp-tRNA(Asn)/Glu-tRNA(Gln) amidotransferase subunit GatC [Deltaproteobacteria bacterium]